jgi:hypothetical protein
MVLAVAAAAAEPGLRRLTHSQYNNTVRDLLGDATNPADQFPREDFVSGFKNQAAAQTISPLLAEAYNQAAERLARNAFLGGVDAGGLIPCKPRGATDAECAAQFLGRFGLRAFRRPLTGDEARRYAALFHREAARAGDFLKGAQAVMEAVLQSPKFLFHLAAARRDGYAAASRLSYFLWDTMPDEELLRAAASGELASEAGVDRAARRMIADPRARQAFDEFVSQWLRFDLLLGAVKHRAEYPQFNPELAAAMAEETRRLVAHVVWNDLDFMDVFRAEYGFLNSGLAALYGFAPPANEFDLVKFPADTDRAGIFGQAAFLALTSKPAETSPTIRGFYVREHFLCQQVPDPPPGTNNNLPPISPSRPQTNRERLREHTVNRTCSGCHALMDPIGFGLEKFDAIGRRREKQKITFYPDRRSRNEKPRSVELELDTRGLVSGTSPEPFYSPKELGRILAGSRECRECVVKQLFRYAYGRRETAADAPLLRQANEAFAGSRFRLKELIMFLAKSLAAGEG